MPQYAEKNEFNIFKLTLNVLILLVAFTATAVAQDVYVGVRGGLGGGTASMRPLHETKATFGVPQAGIMVRYVGPGKIVDGIQMDVEYAVSDFRLLAKNKSDSSYVRRINSIEVPLTWYAHVEADKGRLHVFLNLGPYISYDLSSSESWYGNNVPGSEWEERTETYVYDPLIDNRLGYGVLGGLGVSYLFGGRILFTVEARYQFGFSDIYRNKNTYPDSPYYESQVSQYRVSAGLAYRFGKSRKK